MTLGKLIEAVEAGTATRTQIEELAVQAFGLSDLCIDIASAYARKDLNAALAVHDALVPGHCYLLSRSNAKVFPFTDTADVAGQYGMADSTARAWLLAILKAKQAEGRG
jgi:hypothetical protein